MILNCRYHVYGIIVSDISLKLDALGYIFVAGSLGISSTTFTQSAHDAPPDLVVGWGGNLPPHSQPPPRLRHFDFRHLDPRRLRRLEPGTPTFHTKVTPLPIDT